MKHGTSVNLVVFLALCIMVVAIISSPYRAVEADARAATQREYARKSMADSPGVSHRTAGAKSEEIIDNCATSYSYILKR